jgi:uncharacterized protein (DUF1800 family)
LALSQIFVVSNVNSNIDGRQGSSRQLPRHALAQRLRQLPPAARTGGHPSGHGHYLSHFRNEREDPATGRIPDENFAREVMQLFTIGLWQLNPDGTRRRDARATSFLPTAKT